MKLLFSDTSPYARKCAVVAHEKGLINQIEIERVNPFETDFHEVNPLNKVPCLVLEDAPSLFDSLVICDHLDRLGEGEPLIPSGGADRDRVLRLHAVGQGATDAALFLRAQVMRDAKLDTPLPKDWFIDRQWSAIQKSCKLLDQEIDSLQGALHLGQISVATALGYLDLRFPESAWRHHAPKLAVWYESFSQRPSMQATAPKA